MNVTAQVLDQAADLLEQRGWIQGRMYADEGLCAVGAIFSTARDLDVYRHAIVAFATEIGFEYPWGVGRPCPISAWNDRDGRTKEEVVDHLRWAAKHAREAKG